MVTKIAMHKIKITVRAEKSDISLSQVAKDCCPGFEGAVRENIKKSKTWGWCDVTVMARFKDDPNAVEGTDYLTGCSHISKQDFIDNSGYYEDMVQTAIAELESNYADYCQRLSGKVLCVMKVTGLRDLNHAASILKNNTAATLLSPSNEN